MTRWRQAQGMLLDAEEWKMDNELQKLPALDVLLAFEDYSRVKEREFEEMMRKNQIEKARKERKAREAFKVRLNLRFKIRKAHAANSRRSRSWWMLRRSTRGPSGRTCTLCFLPQQPT